MSKARIIASVVVLVVSIAATGAVGATMLAASASNGEGRAFGSPWSSGDEKIEAENKKGESRADSKLETWDHEGECSEITHPEAVEKVNPTYPPDAREAKITGQVILRSIISDEGMVEDLEVLESPDELLTAAAVDAVKQWRFEPARCDGEPVGVYYNLTINFALK